MTDTEILARRNEEAIALHALGLNVAEIAAEMGLPYSSAHHLLQELGLATAREHATPTGPAIGICSAEIKMRADAWSASDELLRRLRLYHPGGYENARARIVGIFRGAPVAMSSFVGCSMARCVETI